MFRSLIATRDDGAMTIARMTLGIVYFPHGAQKVLGWFGGYGFSGTMHFFTDQLHIPALFALFAILAEFLGSLGLIVGLLGRLAALAIALEMLVAVYMVHFANGFFMNWTGQQKGEGFEYHLLVFGLALIVMLYGSGRYSADLALSRSADTVPDNRLSEARA
jgi:putative oxidoreductase